VIYFTDNSKAVQVVAFFTKRHWKRHPSSKLNML